MPKHMIFLTACDNLNFSCIQILCYSLVSHGAILGRKLLIKNSLKLAEGMGFEPTIGLDIL